MNEQLKSALKQEDTVIFIGSGISCWSGLPSWTGLLNQLADLLQSSSRDAELVRKEIKQDLLQAASYGFDQLTTPEIGEFIRNACKFGTAAPHEIHRKIVTLGPRCFITTNYDQLLEESLRNWKHGRPFRVVTNKQPFEEADIIQARAVDFIFKPHGDVGDIGSIVLTREQYRKLVEGGELKHTLESLKTLFLTRRVVYLGFGLRDPDFLLLRDIIVNTWLGGARDHYAILPDIGSGEIAYWRKHYGIHLVGYKTRELPGGKRDHSPLLEMLDEYLLPATPAPPPAKLAATNPDITLSLLRYASGLMSFVPANPELPLRVHFSKGWRYTHTGKSVHDRWDNSNAQDFLLEGPVRAVLLGLPGAGKSYALRKAVCEQARLLHDSCLAEPPDFAKSVIPLFADMKLYAGDLAALIESTLPTGVCLKDLASQFKLKVFLDSFNEMPREQWERGGYETDVSTFLKDYPSVGLIVGSRTDDGLAKLDLPSYHLDEIDSDFLDKQLDSTGITLSGRFAPELTELLRKPFYFQLVATGRIKLPEQPHPRDFYKEFFGGLSTAFANRFGNKIDLAGILAPFAYDAVSRGEEASPVSALYQSLSKELQSLELNNIPPETVSNWLVSQSVMLPFSGGRVAFFHQSVTEFLAAGELARLFQISPAIIKEKLALTRWDQAIFLTLSILPEKQADAFLEEIVKVDFALALRATKYLETNRDKIVTKLLEKIPARLNQAGGFDFALGHILDDHVPVTETHEPQLRAIMACGNAIGGCAAAKLLCLKGESLKREMLDTLLAKSSDYNYCSPLGSALSSYIAKDDLNYIVQLVDSAEKQTTEGDEEDADGFVTGIGNALGEIELQSITASFLPQDDTKPFSNLRTQIVLDCVQERHSTESLQIAADLLLRGFKDAAFAIHAVATFGREPRELSWSMFGCQHISKLEEMLGDTKNEPWALDALKSICEARHDLAEVVERDAHNTKGIRRAALFNSLGDKHTASVFEAIESYLRMEASERELEPEYLFSRMDLNWVGRENLFLQLLRLRNAHLAWCLCENLAMTTEEAAIGQLDIGDIVWWLDWLADAKDREVGWWFRDRISNLFADKLTPVAQKGFLAEFNRKDSKYRDVLADTILKKRKSLTTDDFSEDAITQLLNGLSKQKIHPFESHLLGITATETFAKDRLVPMLEGTKGIVRANLIAVLTEAGRRHGRRYFAEQI